MADTVKHTYYPWERVDTADYAEIHPVGKRLQSAIALVGKPDDANLIAAAPDLLEALHLVGMSAGWQYLTMETRSVIEAAIAKAEGRS
jgi:hypothetical protein